jgi:hypothetical protein
LPSTPSIAPITLSINVLTTFQVSSLAANLTIGNTPIDGIQNLKMSAFAIVLYSFCLTLVSQRLFQGHTSRVQADFAELEGMRAFVLCFKC